MNAVDVVQLTHTYPATRLSKTPRQALRNLSFSVQAGELFGLLGPNGGGKSTTFHILSTVFRPTGGQVRIFGHDVVQESSLARRELGVVFQAPSLDRHLTVEENLTYGGQLYGLGGRALSARVEEVLERLGLAARRHDRVQVLSGGLKRRTELAKGLLHKPRLLILDEPSTGLDPGARRDLWQYLTQLNKSEKMTILFTTHLMEEAEHCDRVVILNEGSLVAEGTPTALKNEIRGDIITVEAPDPDALAKDIEAKWGGSVRVIEGKVQMVRDNGHAFVPQLATAFPGVMTSIMVGKPTLEDVFVKKTGHRFWVDNEEGL